MDIKLVGFKPSGDRFEIPLTEQSMVIGRGEDCDVRVPISSISRKHCEFSVEGGHVRARDLGSANGTFINNNRVSEVRLSAGDHVVLGALVMTLQINGEPAEIAPPEVVQPAAAAADAAAAEEDIVAEAVSLDEAPIDLGGPAAPPDDEGVISLADDEGAMSLADESAPADAFADLVAEDAGEAVSAGDVLASVDEEIDPIAALEMLTGEAETAGQADMPGAPEDIEVPEAPEGPAATGDTEAPAAPEDIEAPKDLEPGQ